MAWSINKAFILGNVTKDPEMRYTPNGQGVTSFGVATNRRWKDQNGAMQEETQFHDVVAWGKLAELLTQILKKGNKIAVIGRLQSKSWEAPDGSKRNRTEIVMEDFVPLTPKAGGFGAEGDMSQLPSEGGGEESQAPAAKTAKPAKVEKPAPSGDEEINLDDIPF
ncbi:MAG: single-stranded DNA-binding protein [Patescibacteria group bacterium]